MRRVERIVEIEAPVERVFDLFSDFEAFPRWMRGVREVRRTGRRMTHWVGRTAVEGLDAEWDAEVTHFEPDRRVVWRSVRGDVRTDGEAVFAETHEGTTLLRVVTGYATPSGRSGAEAARFFGRNPARQLEEDLYNFKRLVEREQTRRRAARRARLEADERRARAFEESRAEATEASRRASLRGEGRRGGGADYYSPRYAFSPRERERARGTERGRYDERVAATFRRRGVERLLDEEPRGRRGRGRD